MHPSRAAVVTVLLLTSACSRGATEYACTLIGPPFGLEFDLTAVNVPAQPVDSPLVVDVCADDVCQSRRVRDLVTDPAAPAGVDTGRKFVFDLDMSATPTAYLRLHDEGGPVLREVEVTVEALAVSSDVNGERCRSHGFWGRFASNPTAP
ncbi:hypothetical protein ACFFKU_01795 [Kineococcus gynurae]|uniref:Uncharacterized protein n=1 Tax=Kineococcus gynurae TaxID=452979 RepID=A0ABV5LSX2_9ACTN